MKQDNRESQSNYVAILQLGSGSLQAGFSHVTVAIGREKQPYHTQTVASLPPAPELLDLYRKWQTLYVALYASLGWRLRITFPSDAAGVTNISEVGLREICDRMRLRFNEWLTSPGFAPIERKLRTFLNPKDTVRILLETDNFELRKFPWHLWDFWQDFPQAELALSTPQFDPPTSRRVRKGPMRILAVLGSARGLQLDSDLKELQKLPNAKLELLQEPTCAEICHRLWHQDVDIFFFAGHSATTNGGNVGTLEIARNRILRMGDLENALRRAIDRGLQLAIFNSCDGLGILGELENLGLHLPQLVVMREPIPDRVAHKFLGDFLQTFSRGESLHFAVRQAREQLQSLEYFSDDLASKSLSLESTFPCASWMPMIFTHPAVSPLVWPVSEKPTLVQFPSISWKLHKLAAVCAIALLGGYFSLGPQIARGANNIAKYYHRQDELFAARWFYRSATLLDFRFAPPHYNLGWLCEDMGDRNCAIEAYYRAAVRGLAEGYAQASRLQILENNFDEAFSGIRQCLDRAQHDGVRVSCLKNRGWLRFEQEQYDLAERDLQEAQQLAQRIDIDSPHTHCLLAQTGEVLGKPDSEVFPWWFETLRSANPHFPEQEQCISMAQEKLQQSQK